MSNKNNKHILIIRLSALGDVAMTVPVIRAFKEQYPDVRLTVLTKPQFGPVYSGLVNVNIFEAEVNDKHKGVLGLYRLSRELRKLGIDAIADLHDVLRTNTLKVYFFDLPFKQIDKGREEKAELTSGKQFEQLKTTVTRYADVFAALGYPLDLSKPKFPQRPDLKPETIKYIGPDTKKWIGVAPFAAHKGKMYPLDLMEVVIKELSNKYKIILFGGGKSETDLLNNIASKYNNVSNIAGKFTLAEELDIISNLDVMVSMDSGNGHLAAMMGVEVITLWGVTHPYAGFYPFNQDINNALLADRNKFPKIPTSVYGNDYPDDYAEAMRTVAPLRVIEKVEGIVK